MIQESLCKIVGNCLEEIKKSLGGNKEEPMRKSGSLLGSHWGQMSLLTRSIYSWILHLIETRRTSKLPRSFTICILSLPESHSQFLNSEYVLFFIHMDLSNSVMTNLQN